MKKKQKLLTTQNIFFFTIPIVIFVLFIFLSPKISSLVFSFKRQTILNGFINSTRASGTINPQQYWEFRELYSPGYFNFSRQGIGQSLLKQAEQKINVKFDSKKVDLSFLVFSSPLLNSIDMLTTKNSLNEIFQFKTTEKNVLFRNKNSLIYRQDSSKIIIVFLLSNKDMKKANGFFDYNEKDKVTTEGKNWFNITTIRAE
jgi:hypothetical protein